MTDAPSLRHLWHQFTDDQLRAVMERRLGVTPGLFDGWCRPRVERELTLIEREARA